MNRETKQGVIDSLKGDFQQSKATFLVGVQGLTVAQMQALRTGVRRQGGRVQIAKNTFAHIAAEPYEGAKVLQPYLKGQIALVFTTGDSSAVAKVICDSAKENGKITIVAGSLDARFIDKSMVEFLGSLPPREVIVAQVCGTIKAPMVRHVSVLQQLIVRLLFVLKQASEKKQ